MIETLTLAQFTPHLGTEFICRTPDGGTYPLRLAEAEASAIPARKGSRQAETRAAFSLVFLGPQNPVLPQSIYPLDHAELGTLPLFIVPIGRDEEGTLYQAIFN